ncbi:MAG TPA: DEAD/DEAH box helicase, partial [Anaerolineae bacterium]|nr:DEAD/DEAH box helicase [Anaerolineae bacterium]
MSLKMLEFPAILDTSSAEITTTFFQPALSNSIRYDRAVGYFSSGWLRLNAVGLVQFAANGGKARWVTSPILDSADFAALNLGDQARIDQQLHTILRRNVANLQQTLEHDTLSALAWMIADGILTFRLALPNNKLSGDFHDKFGVFGDADGNRLAFIGSYNESIQGTHNSESFSIFSSWQHAAILPYLTGIENRFARLWAGDDPNVQIFDLPAAIKADILQLRSAERPYPEPAWIKQSVVRESKAAYQITRPHLPAQITLRDYQEEAIAAWFENDCRGLFEMATGTGKTITALAAAVRLFERAGRLALVVAVPYQHLVDQWRDELVGFGFRPILAYQSKKRWLDPLNEAIISFNGGYRDVVCVITTHTTFSSNDFQATISRIATSALLIADEVHHLGAERSRQHYPHHIENRLALSATPDRWFDDAGTAALRAYFGRTVFEFPLAKAIGVSLTPYYYYPHLVELTEAELEEYEQLSFKIGRIFHQDDNEEALRILLVKRSRLLNRAHNKLTVLAEL